MEKKLKFKEISEKVSKKQKLTLEEKKIFHEKMVFKNNLMQKWYKKYDERLKNNKEKEKAWDELVKRVEQRYPNREPIKIVNRFNRFKIFK
jgi:DNA-directed RNA polymerase subunit N (RpoN/RPB10)